MHAGSRHLRTLKKDVGGPGQNKATQTQSIGEVFLLSDEFFRHALRENESFTLTLRNRYKKLMSLKSDYGTIDF